MEPLYRQNFLVDDLAVDCFGFLKSSMLLYYMQEVAGNHFSRLEDPSAPLAGKNFFWAVSRHRVEVMRLPRLGETVTVETWPMPTTRVAYPRAAAIYDDQGRLLARSVSLWVLMDKTSRTMVLPGKSGVTVEGILRGEEPEIPRSAPFSQLSGLCPREVTYSLLDQNGHMNNTRYLDWVNDLLPASFHRHNKVKDLAIFYHSEALEGQHIDLHWSLSAEGLLQVDAYRKPKEPTENLQRVFAAQVSFSQ